MSAHKWMICPTCEGEGKHSGHLGAFTSSEWEQEDDDFRERYMSGDYDRTCQRCAGTGKLLVEPHICSCCGEESSSGQDCCTDEYPEPGEMRETGP